MCNMTQLTCPSSDIFVTNVSIMEYGGFTSDYFKDDLIEFMRVNGLNWGPIHHAKVLISNDNPNASTRVMFLRFCDTSCHEEVIREINGIEWPGGSGRFLRFEFKNVY